MIDLHAHLLPGIDDGPASVREAVAMARAAAQAGTTTLVCTPHVHERYPTGPGAIHAAVDSLRCELDREGVPLRLQPGAEIAIDRLDGLGDQELLLASVGGRGEWLMLEMPFRGWPHRLPAILSALELRGYRVILAHPERAEAVQRTPDRMREAVGRGALIQLTAASFLGEMGAAAQRTARALLAGGMAHLLASDGHSAGPWRPPEIRPGLLAAAAAVGADPQALAWMAEEGPAALIEGRAVRPPRLTPARRPREDARPAPGAPRPRSRG